MPRHLPALVIVPLPGIDQFCAGRPRRSHNWTWSEPGLPLSRSRQRLFNPANAPAVTGLFRLIRTLRKSIGRPAFEYDAFGRLLTATALDATLGDERDSAGRVTTESVNGQPARLRPQPDWLDRPARSDPPRRGLERGKRRPQQRTPAATATFGSCARRSRSPAARKYTAISTPTATIPATTAARWAPALDKTGSSLRVAGTDKHKCSPHEKT